MTATLRFVDAAFAASISGAPYDGVCFYIGGNAYHVWPKSDIDGRPERYRLPVWVRSNPGAVNPNSDAAACAAALKAIGAPRGTLVALDSETSISPSWVRTFVGVVNVEGYPVIDYGTESRVHGNDNPDGYYWGADWTSVPHLHSGDGMTQYVSFTGYDESEASASLPFWDTRPAPRPKPEPKEDDMPPVAIQPNPGSPDVGVSFDGTPYKTIGFLGDPSRVGATEFQVRCAFHAAGKGPQFAVVVATMTPAEPKYVVKVPAGSDGVSFHRLDEAVAVLVPNFA